jgi:hypothetical protein
MDRIYCVHDKAWWQAFVPTVMNPDVWQKAVNFLATQMICAHEVSKEECGESADMGQNILVTSASLHRPSVLRIFTF